MFTAKAGEQKSSLEPLSPWLSMGAWQGLWLVDLELLNSLAFPPRGLASLEEPLLFPFYNNNLEPALPKKTRSVPSTLRK